MAGSLMSAIGYVAASHSTVATGPAPLVIVTRTGGPFALEVGAALATTDSNPFAKSRTVAGLPELGAKGTTNGLRRVLWTVS